MKKVTKKNFKFLKKGKKFIYKIKITKKIHNLFKESSGDFSKIHTDLNFCKKNKYEKVMGYGFLITSILSRIYGMIFPGGNELCLKQDCNFISPFFIEDKLIFENQIIYKNNSTKIIQIDNQVKNQHGEKIFNGTATLKIAFSE